MTSLAAGTALVDGARLIGISRGHTVQDLRNLGVLIG
jgi:hypothetical protein